MVDCPEKCIESGLTGRFSCYIGTCSLDILPNIGIQQCCVQMESLCLQKGHQQQNALSDPLMGVHDVVGGLLKLLLATDTFVPSTSIA